MSQQTLFRDIPRFNRIWGDIFQMRVPFVQFVIIHDDVRFAPESGHQLNKVKESAISH